MSSIGWNDWGEYVTGDGLAISHVFTDTADFIAICDEGGEQIVGIELREFCEVAKKFCFPKQVDDLQRTKEELAKIISSYDIAMRRLCEANERIRALCRP